jgi:pilus assembly protein CpaB
MNKRKALAAVTAVLLALLSTAALVRYVQGAEERAVAGEELVEVLVATGDIKAGTPTAEMAERVSLATVQVKVRPDDAVTTFTQIDGLVAAVDLVKGEQLLTTRFVNPGAFQGARSSSVRLPEGANEVTFKLSPERALGGQLRPGDIVTVLASFEPLDSQASGSSAAASPGGGPTATDSGGTVEQKSPNTANVLLNDIMVVRIQFPDDAEASDKEKNGVGVAPTQDLLVTLAVDQPSLGRAVFAAEFGRVWLSYEPAKADSTKNSIVTRDNVYTQTESLLPDPRSDVALTIPAVELSGEAGPAGSATDTSPSVTTAKP